MRAVVAAKSDIEGLEGDPLGLFGVTLRLLDLGDEARVHADSSTTPSDPAGAGHGDSRHALFLVASQREKADFRTLARRLEWRASRRWRRGGCAALRRRW